MLRLHYFSPACNVPLKYSWISVCFLWLLHGVSCSKRVCVGVAATPHVACMGTIDDTLHRLTWALQWVAVWTQQAKLPTSC